MSSSRRPLLAALTVALLILVWGSTWAVIRVGLRGVPPLTGVALRFGLASLVLLAVARLGGIRLGGHRYEPRLWILNAVLSFSLSYSIVYWAEQWIASGLAAVLFATFPLYVAVMAHLWIPGERLTRRGLAGVLMGLAGVAWIFSDDLVQLAGAQARLAAAVMLLSPLASAAANVAVKRWGSGIHPLSLTAVPMGLCAVLVGGLAALLERDAEVVWSLETGAALVYLAIVGSAVTFTLYFWLMEFVPVTRLSLLTYGVPIVAVGVGALVMDEPIGLSLIGGAALILGGVGLAITRRQVTTRGGVVPRRSRME